jgi:hypothetical protein
MPRILTKIRIDEVSAVDRAAGEGTKIVLMKRHDAPTEAASRRAFFLKIFKADAADDGDDDAGDRSDDAGSLADHPIVQIARLLVANGHKADIASALHYLLNTSHGGALLHRVSTLKGETMRTTETVESILKDCGPVSFCKAIVDRGRAPCDEAELVAALTKYASEQHPEKSPAQAFAELYKTESVWRACAIAKAMPFVFDDAPLMVGGTAAQDLNDPSEAIAQLRQIGRDRWPTASEAQQFANAMTDPKNAVLAAKAHRRPSPTTSFEFPR